MVALAIFVSTHLTVVSATEIAGVAQNFFLGENSTLIYQTCVGPVSLLFSPKLTRSFTEK